MKIAQFCWFCGSEMKRKDFTFLGRRFKNFNCSKCEKIESEFIQLIEKKLEKRNFDRIQICMIEINKSMWKACGLAKKMGKIFDFNVKWDVNKKDLLRIKF